MDRSVEYFVKGIIKYSRRGLSGEIFNKLRIQGRMHILGNKWTSRFDIQFGIYANFRDEPDL